MDQTPKSMPTAVLPGLRSGPSKPPVIHCVGDSHSCFFSGWDAVQPLWPAPHRDILPCFKTYHIGAALAYHLARPGTRTRGRELLFEVLAECVPHGGTVLLSFGEVDCRAHLLKQVAKQGRPIGEVVDSCLDGYFHAVAEVVALGYQVIVYNAVPSRISVRSGSRRNNDDYVAAGTWLERNEATRLFNAGAGTRCAEVGARFLENYSHLTDRAGKTIRWYFFDSVHLSQRAMPVTLRALADLFPEWDLEVPPIVRPTMLRRLGDRFAKRSKRLRKEFARVHRRRAKAPEAGTRDNPSENP